MSYNADMSTKKPKAKKKNRIPAKIIGIIMITAAILILSNVGKQVYTMFTLQQKQKLVEEELALLQKENASLVSTRDKLEDPNYVTTYARGEYMFSLGDEKVFYLPSSGEE